MVTKFVSWNVSPEAFSISVLSFRWYTLLFGLSFLSGYIIMRWIYRREGQPLETVDDLIIYMVLATFAGARLGHCLFYEPYYYLANPLEILKVWSGGLASHGATVGIIIALYLLARKQALRTFLWLTDRVAIPVTLTACLVRIGNLFNSEILGSPTEMPWAFVFVRIDNIPRHPVQIYESAAYVAVLILLVVLYQKDYGKTRQGFLTGIFFVSFFGLRFILEFFKARQATYSAEFMLSVGQWLSIPLIIAGIILIVRSRTVKD